MACGLCTIKGFRPDRLLRAALFSAVLLAGWSVAASCEEMRLVATIKPIHSLLTRVTQGVAQPLLLVEGAASPHSFALRPSQVRAVNDADVLVRVSERLEPFTGKLIRSLPSSVRVVTLIDAPGLTLRHQRQGGNFEPHADHAHAAEHAHDAAETDQHIWLDPLNAKVIASYLAEVLAARFPAHADRLRANAAGLQVEIDALTAELAAETAPLRKRPFVVFHDAYQYFDARFGLDAVGSITVSPDVQPSARRLNELRAGMRAQHVVCVFAEPYFQAQLVEAIVEGTGARRGVLDPEGSSISPGPQLYFTLMRNLAGNLKACLAPDT